MGAAWDGGIPDPKEQPKKPLMILIPGVAGDADNMYQIALIRHLRKDFKCVTLLLRGSKGVPITSGLLSHPGSWQDVGEGAEWICDKYIIDSKTGEKRCRIYIYGCSLGASMLGAYLINRDKKREKLYDGAAFYGVGWDYNFGKKFFFESYGGWLAYAVAINSKRVTVPCLEEYRKYVSAEDYEYYYRQYTNWDGYEGMVNNIWCKMFGHKNWKALNDSLTMNGRMENFKMPVFSYQCYDDVIITPDCMPIKEVE